MADGVRLAADLYLPDGAGPFAALLEALPYRKDDLTASYRPEYRRLVAEGRFAVCRVDLRGTGSSEGDATDEYPPSEQRDLAEVIAWLAAQPWSNGRVGMFGTSYSGFNSIQMACERPPALGAICAIYATDDRYTDDVHYMGGALRAVDLVDYCHYMTPMNALPAGPRRVRRGLARRVAPAGGADGAVDADVAAAPARRRVLAPRLAAPRVRAHHLRHDAGRRLGRRLPQQLASAPSPPCECPKSLLMGPVEPHEHGERAPRPPHRPRPRDDPLVRPLAAGRGHGRRPRTADPPLRPPRHPTGARPGPARGRVALRAGLAARTLAPAGADRARDGSGRDGHGHAVRPAGRGRAGVDLLRRRAPVGAVAGPARGRRVVADLRLAGRRRAARGPRPSVRPPAAALRRRGRVAVGQARGRLPRRHLGPRHPGVPQPDPPGELDGADPDRRSARTSRSRSSWRRRPTCSRPGTASAWRWPGPTGPTPGRRRRRSTLAVDRSSVQLELPTVDGPGPVAEPPPFSAPPARGGDRRGR